MHGICHDVPYQNVSDSPHVHSRRTRCMNIPIPLYQDTHLHLHQTHAEHVQHVLCPREYEQSKYPRYTHTHPTHTYTPNTHERTGTLSPTVPRHRACRVLQIQQASALFCSR